ncbi:AAA family ATPase [Streptomyces sp. NBC_00444]|uniref:AAA family ATPase n=1 Tax=Streptomyces sp. NBC_00444 TaxID=2975744 RepID=UPI002E1A5F4B
MNADEIAATHRTVAIEGCDGTGKSTLASRLAHEHGFAVVHCPRTPDSVNLPQRYQELLARSGRLVLDRCFLSELTYGPLYRGGSRITWDEARTLAKAVTNRDGVFLHLTAPAEVIRARLLNRDSEAPALADITALLAAYRTVFTTLAQSIPVITIDTTAEGPPSTE